MSFKDHPHSRGPAKDGASRSDRPDGERSERRGGDRPRGGPSFGARDERGPRREGNFGGDRPRFNDRNDRGPRPEGGFGGGDRPALTATSAARVQSAASADRPRREDGGFGQAWTVPASMMPECGPRREAVFGGDRPRFNDRNDRGPRPEGGFGGVVIARALTGDRAWPRPERSFRRPSGRREEGGFGRLDRPRFNDPQRPVALAQKAASAAVIARRFNRDERGPRPERSFGDRPRREEGGFRSG